MRTRASLCTLAVSFAGQTVNLILLFVSRRLFVQYFTQEYLGVNGLFSNILTVLSLAMGCISLLPPATRRRYAG